MSSASEIHLVCDRTGFPFLQIGNASVSLLPVTWWQLEQRVAAGDGLGADLHQALLDDAVSACRQRSWVTFRDEEREDIFVTGIARQEAIDYVKWLKGSTEDRYAFDLPQADLWRSAAKWMQERAFDHKSQKLLMECGLSPTAGAIVERLISQLRPQTWRDLALFKNGIFEWVRDTSGQFGGLGAPRISRLRHTFDPFHPQAEPVRSLETGRPHLFGLRPIVFSDELV